MGPSHEKTHAKKCINTMEMEVRFPYKCIYSDLVQYNYFDMSIMFPTSVAEIRIEKSKSLNSSLRFKSTILQMKRLDDQDSKKNIPLRYGLSGNKVG